jgi:hypothetical protein
MQNHGFDGVDISAEATGFYWLPYFLQLADDPDLEHIDPRLFLLNPRWVSWFKKCFAQDDKSDQKDSFYITERTRTRTPTSTWSPQVDTLPLRFYTRLRFHLAQQLTREKNYFSAFLFLQSSAYRRVAPFSDLWGATSRRILSQQHSIDDLAALPIDQLAEQLVQLSGRRLPNPYNNAHKLQQVAGESFGLPDTVADAVQRVMEITMSHVSYLEGQIEQVEQWIAEEAKRHPGVACLASIPGIGPVFSSGIAAEIGDTQRFLQAKKWDRKRKRYRARNLRDADDAVAKIAGLWWPRNSSGDFEAEERRMAKSGNRYLRYYLIQAANQMRQYIPEYAAFYARKHREASKHHHKRALVLTARKSVGLIVGLLHRNETFRSKETT